MKYLLVIFGTFAILFGVFAGYTSLHVSSAIVEIETLISFVIAVCALGLAGVIDQLERDRAERVREQTWPPRFNHPDGN